MMNQFLDDVRSRFDDLEKRERIALTGLAVFLSTVVFYLAVWAPINEFVDDGQRDYARHLSLLEHLRSTEAEARASKGKSQRQVSSGSLLTTVTKAAQAVGVSPSRMQPEGSDAVSVWFDSVAFTRLMLFLERLQAREGVVVRQISVERQDESGKVSARLVLRI